MISAADMFYTIINFSRRIISIQHHFNRNDLGQIAINSRWPVFSAQIREGFNKRIQINAQPQPNR